MAWLAAGSTLLFILWIRNWNLRRAQQSETFELTPNCLLTRHPLLFISGKTSLFYSHQYWNSIPDYLAQHGYEVYQLTTTSRSRTQRITEIQNALQTLQAEGKKAHLFIDSTTSYDMEEIVRNSQYESIASIQYFHLQNSKRRHSSLSPLKHPIEETELSLKAKVSTPIAWKLHQFFINDCDSNPAILGAIQDKTVTRQVTPLFLRKAIELAERDFSSSQIGPHHEKHHARSF